MDLGVERVAHPATVRGFVVVQDRPVHLLHAHASAAPEELLRLDDGGREAVHLVEGVVGGKRRTCRRGDAEPPVQGPRAVVSDADGDTLVVEDLTEVVRVHAVDDETDRPTAVDGLRRPDDPTPSMPPSSARRRRSARARVRRSRPFRLR